MVTAQGASRHAVFEGLCAGVSKVAPLRGFNAELFRCKHAYEIDDRHGHERPLRSTAWLCQAVREALNQHVPDATASRLAVFVGTGLRELRSLELWSRGEAAFEPHQLHYTVAVQEAVGAAVPVYTLVNACAAGLFALALAADMLELGEIDVAVVAGCDSITESMYGLLDRSSAVRTEAVQPFDKDRRGVLMGDGAGAVVLMRKQDAGARPVLAALLGVGLSCDASHETAPDATGILRAMKAAHRLAGTSPQDVRVVYAHGTGTALNDSAEATALRQLFSEVENKPQIAAIKSMTGHTSGSSGVISLVAAVEGLRAQIVPPTPGLSNPIDELNEFPVVRRQAARVLHDVVQVNAFGFGGVNAVALVAGAA
jgi:3-oxoacyl-[acyl-carrier-protein] synthase II